MILAVKVWTPWKPALDWSIFWFPLPFICRFNSNIIDILNCSQREGGKEEYTNSTTSGQAEFLTYLLCHQKMPTTIWPKLGNHATLMLMPKFLLCSCLCCAHNCVYTCTVHTDCDCTVVLPFWLIGASHPSSGHHTHRQSQMLSSGSLTTTTEPPLCLALILVGLFWMKSQFAK